MEYIHYFITLIIVTVLVCMLYPSAIDYSNNKRIKHLNTTRSDSNESLDPSVTFNVNGSLLNYFQSLSLDESIRDNFVSMIISTGYNRCYLEFPSLSHSDRERPAEFTVSKANEPFAPADWTIFRDKFKSLVDLDLSAKRKKYDAFDFSNLNNDALLVCPIPTLDKDIDKHSGHLMDFLKNGDRGQVHELIKRFALKAIELISNDFDVVYVSTHGKGVPWLHVRLSRTPKYYIHKPYI